MTARDIGAYAGRALRGHTLRTGLSLLGVTIGVTAVVLLTSLGEGARLYVVGEFSTLGTNLLIVVPGKTETTGFMPMVTGVPHDLTIGDADAIRSHVRGVQRVVPAAAGTARVSYRDRFRDVVVFGATADFKTLRKQELAIGQYLPEGEGQRDQAVCVIGPTIQRELFSSESPLGASLEIGDERFRVIGVTAPVGTSLGMNMDDAVQIPVGRHLRLFNRTSLRRILVEVTPIEALPGAKTAVLALMKERHQQEEDVTILTQDSLLATFTSILRALTEVLVGIAAISLTVAGIGIMNVMLVAVSERTREIGLLKALGATSRQILTVFLTEASLLATLGGLAGLALAYSAIAVFRWIYPDYPAHAPWWAVAAALVVSLAVGTLFGALPARRASRLDPVVALTRR